MTSKANLSTRAKKAREASRFASKVEWGGTASIFTVPGSNGKRYEVEVEREYIDDEKTKGYLLVLCRVGQANCKGNSPIHNSGSGEPYRTVCYHALAGIQYMASLSDRSVSWCANREDAVRLSTLGGTIFKVVSHQSDGIVYGVAR